MQSPALKPAVSAVPASATRLNPYRRRRRKSLQPRKTQENNPRPIGRKTLPQKSAATINTCTQLWHTTLKHRIAHLPQQQKKLRKHLSNNTLQRKTSTKKT
jgi:hypothetical protein